jgi:hypothetical protein
MVVKSKAKKQKEHKRLLNYYKVRSLEEKLAKDYCHTHSISANRNNTPGEIKETVFVGTPESLTGEVLAEIGALRGGEIPEYPQGLVIHDSRGQGAFD